MAHILADRVQETSTTTGTGTLNLDGAVSKFQTFVAGIGNSNTVDYVIVHRSAAEWEVGIGTVTDATPDTLSRTTVLSSSNAGSLVDFSAGTKDVFCSLPAKKAAGFLFTGTVLPYVGATAPTGWIILTGSSPITTIGDASSGASRANADCEDLFTLVWDSMTDTEAPVSSGRGANAAADWAAHKTITIPNPRGRAVIGTGTGSGLTARTHGATGGAETHALSEAELAAHAHASDSLALRLAAGTAIQSGSSTGTTGAVDGETIGSGTAHANMQPWLALNLICKL